MRYSLIRGAGTPLSGTYWDRYFLRLPRPALLFLGDTIGEVHLSRYSISVVFAGILERRGGIVPNCPSSHSPATLYGRLRASEPVEQAL
jgi:hypothetical protein